MVPQYPLSEFKKLKSSEIKQLKSCELTSDGEYLCTVIIPPLDGGMTIQDSVKTRAEQVAVSGNSVGGKELGELAEPQ